MKFNLEQIEAMAAELNAINEKHNREQGWRYGKPIESRKQRIKRVRRWRSLDEHYPDRCTREAGADQSYRNWRLQSILNYKDVTLMVTAMDRVVPSIYLDFKDWDRIVQYNGYCRFTSKPVIERGYHGILSYVPVHGGITFCQHKQGVSVYGFDTHHAGDEDDAKVRNVEWVEAQCALMADSIRLAGLYESEYLRFTEGNMKAWVLDRYVSHIHRLYGQRFKLTNNFGAMLNVMFGQL